MTYIANDVDGNKAAPASQSGTSQTRQVKRVDIVEVAS
jgi:hypothetical protein